MTRLRHYLLIGALTVVAGCAGPVRAPFEAPEEEKSLPAAPSGPLASLEQGIQAQAGASDTIDNPAAISGFKLLDRGEAGDNIGALIRGVARDDVERGQVLAKPGSVNPHTEFSAEVYVLSKDEGGRHTPFFANYRPQFYFRTTDVTGEVILPEGTEMVMPGDNVTISVKLIAPIAMDEGLRFAIREGGRTVGSGVVSSITK